MTELGMSSGAEKFPVQSSSTYNPYPPPEATYEDVMASRELFMETLQKHHSSMGTKFMIPIVGGKGLDLYLLFVEVTSRGGIAKVVKERKWKEVTSVFNFPSSATNASFILRKYYISLLYHYEQIYFFKAKGWTPSPVDALQNVPTMSQQNHTSAVQHKEEKDTHMHEVPEIPSKGTPVCGIIDGKFESGYLITVRIGSEELKGVLYNIPSNREPQAHTNYQEVQRDFTQVMNHQRTSLIEPGSSSTRRKRRRKSEIRRRDPSRPKPNRSGYNFYFAEQHPLLKPHYHGRDRDISRTIGETWNKLQEHERSVYQEKALRDKERYLTEMAAYKERLRMGQPTVRLHQQQPLLTTDLNFSEDINDVNLQFEIGSDKSEKSSLGESESGEDDNGSNYDDENSEEADLGLKNVNIEVLPGEMEVSLDLQMRADNVMGNKEKDIEDCVMDGTSKDNTNIRAQMLVPDEAIPGEVPIEDKDQTLPGDDLIPSLQD